jgi:hypothetical protein
MGDMDETGKLSVGETCLNWGARNTQVKSNATRAAINRIWAPSWLQYQRNTTLQASFLLAFHPSLFPSTIERQLVHLFVRQFYLEARGTVTCLPLQNMSLLGATWTVTGMITRSFAFLLAYICSIKLQHYLAVQHF